MNAETSPSGSFVAAYTVEVSVHRALLQQNWTPCIENGDRQALSRAKEREQDLWAWNHRLRGAMGAASCTASRKCLHGAQSLSRPEQHLTNGDYGECAIYRLVFYASTGKVLLSLIRSWEDSWRSPVPDHPVGSNFFLKRHDAHSTRQRKL